MKKDIQWKILLVVTIIAMLADGYLQLLYHGPWIDCRMWVSIGALMGLAGWTIVGIFFTDKYNHRTVAAAALLIGIMWVVPV